MSENSVSSGSSRLCGYGLIANHFVAKTQLNGVRRFYKCPRFDEEASCGLWKWRDEEMPPHVMMLIHNLNTLLKSVEVERNYLKKIVANLEDVVSAERLKMEKIMEELPGCHDWSADLASECRDWIADLVAECHDWIAELAYECSDWIADWTANLVG
ncbi:hypothetical protein A4A49_56419 [Nicotiana attenuata]|uniref:GRF-type domain-containing protein n=1 Tax=Nicotiana attenuata TaxID=49451 RepID=A0A314KJE7_NICAT|nr:hypothetical protein A4A49_56419 [Nicotiana attenuata]